MWDLLTPEERAFKERCRRFAEDVIAPRAEEHDRTGAFPREVHELAWEAGLGNVAVPRGPGVSVGENTSKIGFRCLPTPTVRFDGVLVPDDDVIGQVGDAEAVLLETLEYMRFGGASVILGIAVASLRAAVAWVEER